MSDVIQTGEFSVELSEAGLAELLNELGHAAPYFQALAGRFIRKGFVASADLLCIACVERSIQVSKAFLNALCERHFLIVGSLVC